MTDTDEKVIVGWFLIQWFGLYCTINHVVINGTFKLSSILYLQRVPIIPPWMSPSRPF
jgi:hypothetical protein